MKWWQGSKRSADLERELQLDLELEEEEQRENGLSTEEAHFAAQRAFGNTALIREKTHEAWGWTASERFFRDVRYAIRRLRKSHWFSATAVLILALGIGANTAIFQVVYAVLFQPLPYANPSELVRLTCDTPGTSMSDVGLAVPELEDLQRRSDIFEGVSAVWPMDGNLTGANVPTHIEAMAVSENYFRLLGANPLKGHLFLPEDGIPWMSENSVISYGAWQRLFGGDPDVIGRKVKLDYDGYVVVGVLPREFHHPGISLQGEPDFYITGSFRGGPFPPNPTRTIRMIPAAIARLKSGVRLEQAQSRLLDYATKTRQTYSRDYPAEANWTPQIVPLQASLASGSRQILLIMSGTAALVLLICCITIATLFLARASERRREMAIRIAIGAQPLNVIRQFVMECALITIAGTVIGGILAALVTPQFSQWAPFPLPHVNEFGFNGTVFGFTVIVCISTAFLGSIAPAFYSLSLNLAQVTRENGTGPDGSRFGARSRSVLVVGQIALSVTLLSGTGLLLKTMWSLMHIDPGFKPSSLLVGSIWLPPPGNPAARKYETPESRSIFAEKLLRRLKITPGVTSAALGTGNAIPLVGWNSSAFQIEGMPATNGTSYAAQISGVSEDYLPTIGAHVESGRDFSADDRGDFRVALVNRSLADRIWSGTNPIGHRIGIGRGDHPAWYEIVGVTNDVKSQGFDRPAHPHIYVPIYHHSDYAVSVFVRTSVKPQAEIEAVGRAVTDVDPDLTIFAARSMDQVVARSLGPRRFALVLIGSFALIAVVLSMAGVYAITTLLVSQRRREIGIRMALGASKANVLLVVLQKGMRLTFVGIGVGLFGAVFLAGSLKSILFEVSPADPAAYVGVAIVVACSALIACYIPARSAAAMDPSAAIRSE
jgi:predicted permease